MCRLKNRRGLLRADAADSRPLPSVRPFLFWKGKVLHWQMPEGLRVPRGSGRELDQSGIPAVSYVRLKGLFKEMCRFNLPWRHQRALAQVPFPCIDGYPAFRREKMDFRPSTNYMPLFGANVTFPVCSILSSRAEKQLPRNLQLRTLAFCLTWLRALFP